MQVHKENAPKEKYVTQEARLGEAAARPQGPLKTDVMKGQGRFWLLLQLNRSHLHL